jgi:hypothetical protein
MRPNIKTVSLYLWLATNFAVMLLSAQTAYRKSLNTEEYAYACDSFGYLRMAQEIRASFREHKLPEFRLESNQTRLLIEFMKSKNLPLAKWDEMVAPHAHHYFPTSDHVGVQYPPGTGLALALFPEGTAVYRLNRITIVICVIVGAAALGLAAWKRAWVSAALVTLAIHLVFTILGRIGTLSFSINAAMAPLLLTCALVVLAAALKKAHYRLAWSAALASGLLLGLCTLIRLPAVLLAPAFLILLWPRNWRPRVNSLPVIFCLATFVAGVLPLLVNQQRVAGAWYLTTYASNDAAPPTLARVRDNLNYFFGFDGPAAQDNWALLVALVGFAGFALIRPRRNQQSKDGGLAWQLLAVAVLIAWLPSVLFFLTHAIAIPYYMVPAVVVAVALVGFGALMIEATDNGVNTLAHEPRIIVALVVVALAFPAVATVRGALTNRSLNKAPAAPLAHPRIVLPAELADEKAWVWADLLTGSLWYYARKPAFKIQFTDPPTRELLYQFVFARGERQYLIQDSEQMRTYLDEVVRLGGTLEERGKVDGQTYYLVHWPAGGPAVGASPSAVSTK